MNLKWVKRLYDKWETEDLYAGTKKVAFIRIDRDICGHLIYVGCYELPTLPIRSQNVLKDVLKIEMEYLVVEWFTDTNKANS